MTEPGAEAPTISCVFLPDSSPWRVWDPGKKPIAPFKGSACIGVSGMCTPKDAQGPGRMVSLCLVWAGAPAGVSTTTMRSNSGKPALVPPDVNSSIAPPLPSHCAKVISATFSSLMLVLLRKYRASKASTSGWATMSSCAHSLLKGGTVISRCARMRLKVTPSGRAFRCSRKSSNKVCNFSGGKSLSSTTSPFALRTPRAVSRSWARPLASAFPQPSQETTGAPVLGRPRGSYRNVR
mmetsp:Transcript_39389/g.88133  ORF Transcript_39389/g.88133 Transcript_39389/m.88133 type:complete len:237 (-) Transcript_39389:17-727(-)